LTIDSNISAGNKTSLQAKLSKEKDDAMCDASKEKLKTKSWSPKNCIYSSTIQAAPHSSFIIQNS
jgi:hypothetical protein